MQATPRVLAGAVAALAIGAGCASPEPAPEARGPLVIAHRGASGSLPEHTLAAYSAAIAQGADFVEPDLVMTRDGVLVARHENEISATTDVAERPEFASRRTTKQIDGTSVSGWFSEDFTLRELKTLRARERIPQLRPANARFDGLFEIPSFDEVLELVDGVNEDRRRSAPGSEPRPVGVYPETKHPSYFQSIGLAMEGPLLRSLGRAGGSRTPVRIQSFEVANLKQLAKLTSPPRVQLLAERGQPWDFAASGDPRTYADLASAAGLAEIATYASGVGVHKDLLIPRTPDDRLGTPTRLVADAHAAGLFVHAWTFRAENAFLPRELRSGADATARGDLGAELARFLALGVDGVFSDQPDLAVRARDDFLLASSSRP